MYEMTSKPLVSRTLATLRSAEFGFFGVVVYTRVHTPRRWGLPCIAGDLDFVTSVSRPWRTSWLMVGIGNLFPFEVTSFPAESEAPRWEVGPKPRMKPSCAVGRPDKERSRVCRKALDYIRVNPPSQ